MRHVWIVNHYAQEPVGFGVTRHFSLARHLAAHGWKATIIAASTDHPGGRQRLEAGEASRLQTFDGVPFLWLRAREYSGNGTDRILNMVDFTRAALRRGMLSGIEPPDVVIGSSVHPLAAWAGRRLARRFRVPFVFEVRDLWPQTLIDMGRVSARHPATLALQWLERSLYRSAARIVVVLPNAGDYIEPLGIPRDKIVWIPNGVDPDWFPPPPPASASDTFTLMYFGAHGEANGLATMLEAMRLVERDPAGQRIVLRLIGKGPQKPVLVAMAREAGLRNVRFDDPVSKVEIPGLAAEADAFVICVRNMPGLYRFGISMNKIFDYLAGARPTIIAVDAANNPIAEAGAGLTVAPEDPQALAAAILAMAALQPERRREMGAAGRRYLEGNHRMDLLAGRLASTLNACVPAL